MAVRSDRLFVGNVSLTSVQHFYTVPTSSVALLKQVVIFGRAAAQFRWGVQLGVSAPDTKHFDQAIALNQSTFLSLFVVLRSGDRLWFQQDTDNSIAVGFYGAVLAL